MSATPQPALGPLFAISKIHLRVPCLCVNFFHNDVKVELVFLRTKNLIIEILFVDMFRLLITVHNLHGSVSILSSMKETFMSDTALIYYINRQLLLLKMYVLDYLYDESDHVIFVQYIYLKLKKFQMNES